MSLLFCLAALSLAGCGIGQSPQGEPEARLAELAAQCDEQGQSGGACEELTTFLDRRMVEVPAGEFIMGNDDTRPSEAPQRRVYLDAYAIDTYEVTKVQYARFLGETGWESPPGWSGTAYPGGQTLHPVVNVPWEDAAGYCAWAGKRLPTEAEWEKAARGEDGRVYPWGDEWDATRANTAEAGPGTPMPVGSFPDGASPYGALDMAGNVWEWVSDRYDTDYYAVAPDRNPTGPTEVLDHGLRGGAFDSDADQARTAFRNSSHAVGPNPRVGFRCAR